MIALTLGGTCGYWGGTSIWSRNRPPWYGVSGGPLISAVHLPPTRAGRRGRHLKRELSSTVSVISSSCSWLICDSSLASRLLAAILQLPRSVHTPDTLCHQLMTELTLSQSGERQQFPINGSSVLSRMEAAPCRLSAPAAEPTDGKLLHLITPAACRPPEFADCGCLSCMDPQLSLTGQQQCARLRELCPELVVCAPLARAIATAQLGLPQARVVVLEELSPPLARRSAAALRAEFGCVAQWAAAGNDALWLATPPEQPEHASWPRRSADLELQAGRACAVFEWLGAQPDTEIAVVAPPEFWHDCLRFGSPAKWPRVPASSPSHRRHRSVLAFDSVELAEQLAMGLNGPMAVHTVVARMEADYRKGSAEGQLALEADCRAVGEPASEELAGSVAVPNAGGWLKRAADTDLLEAKAPPRPTESRSVGASGGWFGHSTGTDCPCNLGSTTHVIESANSANDQPIL